MRSSNQCNLSPTVAAVLIAIVAMTVRSSHVFAENLEQTPVVVVASSNSPSNQVAIFKKFFIYLGYNRSFFSPSSIKFKGKGHNFELKNVTASDRASDWGSVYFTNGSVPQYNLRLGYRFAPHWNVSFGVDHMKYVVDAGQTVVINGTIKSSASEKYAGTYRGDSIFLEKDFLTFEHTDGFNYLPFELESQHPVDFLHQLGLPDAKFLSLIGGVGFGAVVPRSDVRLFGKGRNHYWNLSGWGTSMHVGIQLDMWNTLFARFTGKYGRVELKDIPTTGQGNDRAEQLIHFMENLMSLGYVF
jgi:hypothetical protein